MEKDIESKQEKVYDENWDPKIICPICGKYRFNDEYDICPYIPQRLYQNPLLFP